MIKTFSPIFAFVIGLGIIFVVLLPGWKEIKNLKIIKKNKIQMLADLRSWSTHFDKLSARYQEATDDLQKLSLTIPHDPQIAELLVQLEDMARRNGLAVNDIQFNIQEQSAKSADKKNTGVINIELKMEGGYSNFKSFTVDIEKNVRLMDIFGASIDAAGDGLMQFNIKLSTYYENL